ncbi:MAG: TetR/AcrR family transcriptional regulator [Hamadaea sp.]|nr:TetR/AcrR family transcriptional regulator [Hamadaea sp.]
MTVFAGQGDPVWSITALWRPSDTDGTSDGARERSPAGRTTRGPKQSLTVDAIVRAAVEIADRDGLAGLSMRTVGDALGRTGMALYTYVPGKGELIDLMYDAAHAELPTHYEHPDWRAGVTAWADDLFAFHLRHPWTLEISFARPALGPHQQAVLEALADLLRATGLPAPTVRPVVTSVFHLVRGAAQTVTEARSAARATGTSDEDWWSARSGALLAAVPDFAARFPATAWLGGDPTPPKPGVPYLEGAAAQALAGGLAVLFDGLGRVEAARPPDLESSTP